MPLNLLSVRVYPDRSVGATNSSIDGADDSNGINRGI